MVGEDEPMGEQAASARDMADSEPPPRCAVRPQMSAPQTGTLQPSAPASLFDQNVVAAAQIRFADGGFTRINPRCAALLGFEPNGLAGRTLISLAVPEERDLWGERLTRLSCGALSECSGEMHCIGGNGCPVRINLTLSAFTSGGTRADECVAILHGISPEAAQAPAPRIEQEPEATFRAIYENIQEGVYRSSIYGRQLAANPALVRLNGYDSEAEMLANVHDIATEWYVDPTRRAEFQATLREHGRVERFISEVYRHKTRERIWVEENAHLVRDPATGEALYYEGTVREVTGTVEQLRLHERLQRIGAVISACLFQLRRRPNATSAVPYAGLGLEPLFGLAPEDVRNDASPLLAAVHRDDRTRLSASLLRSATRMTPWALEFRVNHPHRGTIWLSGRAVPDREPDGSVLWHGLVSDVTALKTNERQIYELAYFDSLTGLPNRQMLRDRLAMALAASRRRKSFGALLFIDLDNFKLINDSYGHDVGDLLLASTAQRLRLCLRELDTVARLGGDEFVVLLQDLGDTEAQAIRHADRVARKVLQAVDQPCLLNEQRFQTTCSIGLTLLDGRESDPEELLKRADLAMYEAKAAGRNGLSVFSPAKRTPVREHVGAVADFRRAIDAGGIEFLLEAQYDVDGICRGAELLPCWHHERWGTFRRQELASFAEETGQAEILTRQAIAQACALLGSWGKTAELCGLSLSVGVSARMLHERGAVRRINRFLLDAGADPRRLTLELPEIIVGKNDVALADKMHRLRRSGVRFTLKSFGGRLTRLAQLKALPFDEIKIDPADMRDIAAEPPSLIRKVVRIADSLNLMVIAEGVETEAQQRALLAAGCDRIQGPLSGAPMPPQIFEERFAGPVIPLQVAPLGQQRFA
ncbi:hypothetical protein CKO32_01460 [Afifella marina DSM 2698]|nr:hypothetical protein [Afifella marina DSM 2698]MBK1628348.1 hypothetical protein [Afifella marina]MBK5919007.1 hypothetical protein [Afifella marina]RAI20252.1 hypothetical protein CH311_10535 [Afifella marina DSM 2698]